MSIYARHNKLWVRFTENGKLIRMPTRFQPGQEDRAEEVLAGLRLPMPADAILVEPGEPTVYFVRSGARGNIKVGYTINLFERLRGLKTGSPESVHVVLALPGTRRQEQHVHGALHHARVVGEWFKPTAEVLSLIRRCYAERAVPGALSAEDLKDLEVG